MTPNSTPLTANDRLKARSTDTLAIGLILAVGVHFLVIQLWPEMSAEDWRDVVATEVTVIDMDEIPLPVAPEPLRRPVAPVIGADVDPTATIDVVPFERARELPPPPPPADRTPAADRSGFVVYEVAPRLTNPRDFQRALERAYPSGLRDAGIGGTVTLEVFVEADGRATDARVATSSGFERLDEVAVGLIDAMRFSPAMNRDRRVAVWVRIPIEFRTRR